MLFKRLLSLSQGFLSKKLLAFTAAVLLAASSAAPASVFEIRALFVSLDVIQHSPLVLNNISFSELNDLVIGGFFKDNDFSSSGSKDKKSSGGLNTNLDCVVFSVLRSEKPDFTRIINDFSDYTSISTFHKTPVTDTFRGGGGINTEINWFYHVDDFTIVSSLGLMHWLVKTIMPRGSLDNGAVMPVSFVINSPNHI